MRVADRFGLSMGPLVLRVLLAFTFIWAGLGKVLTTTEIGPDAAARLAQMKIAVTPNAPTTPDPASSDLAPTLQLPEPATSEPTPEESPADEAPVTDTAPSFEEVSLQTVAWTGMQAPTTAQPNDFPEGATVRSLYTLALLIDSAADPGLDDNANPIKPIWPASLAKGSLPRNLAWLAAISEIGLGLTLLLGLVTRLSALGIAGIMGTAAWLTQIGPAIQAGNPRLGFLPTHEAFDIAAWQPFAWQMSLFMAALALLCMGSGAIGLDRALFRKREANPPVPTAAEPAARPDYREIEATPDYDPAKNPFDRGEGNDEA